MIVRYLEYIQSTIVSFVEDVPGLIWKPKRPLIMWMSLSTLSWKSLNIYPLGCLVIPSFSEGSPGLNRFVTNASRSV